MGWKSLSHNSIQPYLLPRQLNYQSKSIQQWRCNCWDSITRTSRMKSRVMKSIKHTGLLFLGGQADFVFRVIFWVVPLSSASGVDSSLKDTWSASSSSPSESSKMNSVSSGPPLSSTVSIEWARECACDLIVECSSSLTSHPFCFVNGVWCVSLVCRMSLAPWTGFTLKIVDLSDAADSTPVMASFCGIFSASFQIWGLHVKFSSELSNFYVD